MHGSVRNLVTKTLMPLAWRDNNSRAARALKRFADTEADSGWHYLRAMSATDDGQMKQMLFANAFEEFRHSDYFTAVAHQLATQRLSGPACERSRLVRGRADLPYFLAYASESERSIHGQFSTYARACGIKEVSEVFDRIGQDEEEHESRTESFLDSEVGPKQARFLILRVRLIRMTEAWSRASQAIGELMFAIVLRSIFFAYGAAMITPRGSRKNPGGSEKTSLQPSRERVRSVVEDTAKGDV
jgi:rubrerythrin